MKTIFFYKEGKKIKMQRRLWEMIMIVAIPLILVIIILAVLGLAYALRYNAILNNVTTARTNQDFKDNVDLKMYYYVIDSNILKATH